jgi:hypothetical protein
MFRKSITLALAAAVSLGAFALSSSTASAFHSAGGGSFHAGSGGGGQKFGGGLHVNSKPFVTGIRIMPGKVTGIVIKPNFNHHWHWPRWYWWRHTWARPYWIAPAIAAGGVAAYATTPTTNRCTCLTKEYTPQGQVVFKDVCTNEMAMNPPVTASPAAYNTAPEMPQQQGYLQQQPSQVQ